MASALWTSLVTEPRPARRPTPRSGECVEHRLHSPQDRFVATDEQRELSLERAFAAAVEGRVEQLRAARLYGHADLGTTPGALVVWSITADPGFRPSSTPLGRASRPASPADRERMCR